MKKFITTFLILTTTAFSAFAGSLEVTENLLTEAIIDNGGVTDYDNELRINIISGKTLLMNRKTSNVQLSNFEFDTEKRSFTGNISLDNAAAFDISGKYSELMQVPVLNRKLSKRDIITLQDIDYKEMDASRIMRRGYITDEDSLIGQSPTQNITSNRPILPRQVIEPSLVDKKDIVTIVFKNNVLTMQDIGTALEDGAQGDVIKIKNNSSNKIIKGKVIDKNVVEVSVGHRNFAGSHGTYN